jgi:hypothetical protein
MKYVCVMELLNFFDDLNVTALQQLLSKGSIKFRILLFSIFFIRC